LPPPPAPPLFPYTTLFRSHWRLVHDVRLSEYLGEMIDYTPGVHLIAALAGAWLRTDGLHAVYAVVAFTVALKAGLVFHIARRFVDRKSTRLNSSHRTISYA